MVGFIYAGGGVISWVFVYFCIPEVSYIRVKSLAAWYVSNGDDLQTLGRSLEEIQVMMGEHEAPAMASFLAKPIIKRYRSAHPNPQVGQVQGWPRNGAAWSTGQRSQEA